MSFFKELAEYLLEIKEHRMTISLKTLINSMSAIAESVLWYGEPVNLDLINVGYNTDGYLQISAKQQEKSGEGVEYLKVLVAKDSILCADDKATLDDNVIILQLNDSIYTKDQTNSFVSVAHIIAPSNSEISSVIGYLNSVYWDVKHDIYDTDPDKICEIMAAVMEYNSYVIAEDKPHLKLELEFKKDELLVYNYNKQKLYFKLTFTYEVAGEMHIVGLEHNIRDLEY